MNWFITGERVAVHRSTEQARTDPATLSDGPVPETRFISLQINKEKHRHNKVCMETK